MRAFLEEILAEGMDIAMLVQSALPAVLVVGIVIILLSPWPRLRRLTAGLMLAVWGVCLLWMLLDAIEAFIYDRTYALFLFIFPGEYMGLSLLLAAVGLILHRLRGKREISPQPP